MSSLMMAAVRMRMSLMRSSSVGTGLTFIGMTADPLDWSCAPRPGRSSGN